MSTGWQNVRLGEILHRSSETIDLMPSSEYREITVRLWGKGVTLRGTVTGAQIASQRRYIARYGQFILSRIDARNGAFGLVPEALHEAIVSNDFPVFGLNDNRIHSAYLGWMSKTASFVGLCKRASEGTTNRVRLSEDRFLSLEIPLPPIEEQRRIVARIETLAAEIDHARTLRHQATEEADVILTAQTTRAFEDLLKGACRPISTLGIGGVNPIQIGPFGAQLHKIDFVDEGVPVLNVGNVWPDGLRLESVDRVTHEKAVALCRYAIAAGDLLFARSGATLGKVCLVPPECNGWLMTGHLFRVRFDPNVVMNRFAFVALRYSMQIQEKVFGQIRGATRPGYNSTLLGSVRLPVVSLREQRRIVAELDELQAEVDRLKALQAETAAGIDALLPAILDRAFKGELTGAD